MCLNRALVDWNGLGEPAALQIDVCESCLSGQRVWVFSKICFCDANCRCILSKFAIPRTHEPVANFLIGEELPEFLPRFDHFTPLAQFTIDGSDLHVRIRVIRSNAYRFIQGVGGGLKLLQFPVHSTQPTMGVAFRGL